MSPQSQRDSRQGALLCSVPTFAHNWLVSSLPSLPSGSHKAPVKLFFSGQSHLKKVKFCKAGFYFDLSTEENFYLVKKKNNSRQSDSSSLRSGFLIYFTSICSIAVFCPLDQPEFSIDLILGYSNINCVPENTADYIYMFTKQYPSRLPAYVSSS